MLRWNPEDRAERARVNALPDDDDMVADDAPESETDPDDRRLEILDRAEAERG